ncbi:hypothetical protein BTS2_0233 [Bacillus sp. TS-2]|nr:hypothetical protein BTS2_0233 [Bacillus sp. TS-2]
MKKINELLQHKQNNYIYPFLWMHGESKERIETYVNKINESGIKALCIEPRPHPDFLGEQWWHDVKVVLNAAKKLDMKVWLFDDAHFPTGYANGAIVNDFPDLRKKFLKIAQIDYHGPKKNTGILVKWHAGGDRNSIMAVGTSPQKQSIQLQQSSDEIIGVVAAKVVDFNSIDTNSLVDITDRLVDGVVYWDLPEGSWRIFTLIETFHGGEAATEGYLNPIDPRATQVLIDTVYESHYEQLKEYFGTTIAGFFTDEPRFGNVKGPHAKLGETDMVLPWSKEVLRQLENSLGQEAIKWLPLLVSNGSERQSEIRYTYMNIVSTLYGKNFTDQLSNWCVEHGVEYVGHLIEDNNAHARLGYGAGHFFRALNGQTMSGIDVVLHQLLPGLDSGYFKTFTSTGWDGEFFHYGLAKMGASLGHLDQKKKGRTMVELYGAYGWSEGLNLMKWMTDHMLVRGVNHFVPHSFNLSTFPDIDCPPHFYANGEDPQFPYLKKLMNYTNRVAHLLSDGTHIASSLLLYHAEAEWSGESMLFQKPAKMLMTNQLDFDVISIDLLEGSSIQNEQIVIHNETFNQIIIPYASTLPLRAFRVLTALMKKNINIIFIDGLPEYSSEGVSIETYIEEWSNCNNCHVTNLNQLATLVRSFKSHEIILDTAEPSLRYYQYRHDDEDVFMFFNESANHTVKNVVEFRRKRYLYQYDAYCNKVYQLNKGKPTSKLSLELQPQESTIFLSSDQPIHVTSSIKKDWIELNQREIEGTWNVELFKNVKDRQPDQTVALDKLENMSHYSRFPRFSGTFKYKLDFHIDKLEADHAYYLDLGEVYEVATLAINGQVLDTKIAKPYTFDLTKPLRSGSNHLEVSVINTLGNQEQDFLSQYRLLEPSGLIGPVKLRSYKEKNLNDN